MKRLCLKHGPKTGTSTHWSKSMKSIYIMQENIGRVQDIVLYAKMNETTVKEFK